MHIVNSCVSPLFKIILFSLITVLFGCASNEIKSNKLQKISLNQGDGSPESKVESVTISGSMAPETRPLWDKYWVVTETFTYPILDTGIKIEIPKGFITDLASVPRGLWSLGLSPIDEYMPAAVIHDYLYWDQRCPKSSADDVLKLAMYESGVNSLKRWLVFRGVSWFGDASFEDNYKQKRHGEKRFLTDTYTDSLRKRSFDQKFTMKNVVDGAREKGETLDGDNLNNSIKTFCATATAEVRRLNL